MTGGSPREAERRVVRSGSAEQRALEADGWQVVARSWAAALDVTDPDRGELGRVPELGRVSELNPLIELVRRVERESGPAVIRIRELTSSPRDTADVLELDRATADDYPGDVATAHDLLPEDEPVASGVRRAWGAYSGELLVAVTMLELSGPDAESAGPDAEVAPVETGFTVVRRGWRGRGLGTAVKAASVLALAAEGHRHFRTGGAAENTASLRANAKVGYVVDEEWVTLGPPAR